MRKCLLSSAALVGLLSAPATAILGGVAISALLEAPAFAADLPARMPVKAAPAPVVVAVYSWSGCYIGGHVGGIRAKTEMVNTANSALFSDLSPGEGFSVKDTGIIGGGQFGCNFQTGQFVFGIEGAGSWTGLKTTFNNTVFGVGDDVFEVKGRWMASVTGRVGIAFNNWLPYVKGGFAAAGYSLSVSDPGVVGGSGNDKHTHTGWTVGAGVEYGLTPNWIFGVEYDYYRFSKESYELGGTAAPLVYTFDFKPRDVHAVVGRLSYKFGGPVVARY